MSLDDLYLFVLTVRHGGISAAANAYSLQRSKVSRRLQELEKALGCQLLIRTTRQIELTENGRLLYDQVSEQLATVNQAVSSLHSKQKELHGLIRIAVPSALITSNMFASLIDQFAATFPLVSLEILHCQESIDLKRENIDLQLLPSTKKVLNEDYVQQSLLPLPCRLVASSEYLTTHGEPKQLKDLYQHRILVSPHNAPVLPEGLTIQLCTDDLLLIQHMAKSGHGVALLPAILVQDAIADGELVPVLPTESIPEIKLTLVYPSKVYLPEKTRVMVQLLRETFVKHPARVLMK